MYRTLALAQEQKKQTMNLRSERIYVSSLPFNYCACNKSHPHKTPNMVHLNSQECFFQYPGPQTPNHDKINQVRKTKHPYLLTLPWTTIFALLKNTNRAYKLTLYLPSNSRKRPMKKVGDVETKNKEANKTWRRKKVHLAPTNREKSPSWPKPNLCETWVMKNCDCGRLL